MKSLQSLIGEHEPKDSQTTYSTDLDSQQCPYIRYTPEDPNFSKQIPMYENGSSVQQPSNYKNIYDNLKNTSLTDIFAIILISVLMAYLLRHVFDRISPKTKVVDAREQLLKKSLSKGLNLDDYEIGNPWKRHKTIYGGKEDETI